jgi:hypothetical protein
MRLRLLQKRVRKLEIKRVSVVKLVPNSAAWWDYWGPRLRRFQAGEDVKITIEAFRMLVAIAEGDVDSKYPAE